MRQVIASQCSIAVFRQSSPAYVQPTLKRVRRDIARSGDSASRVLMDAPLSGSTGSGLTLQDAAHAHALDSLTLSTSSVLTVAAAAHAHALDSLALDAGAGPSISVADVSHGHAADGVSLAVSLWLMVSDALHAHRADFVSFVVTGIRAARSSRRAPRMDGAGRRPRQTQ